jgi:hypothetical protein
MPRASSSLGSITDSSGNSIITTNVVNSRKNLTVPSLRGSKKQNISWNFSSYNSGIITGLGGNDLNFSYQFYVLYFAPLYPSFSITIDFVIHLFVRL